MAITVDDIRYTSTLVAMCCADCGLPWGVPYHFQERRREDHKTFYCPNGHSNWYPQENKEERLAKELDAAKRDAQHQREQRVIEERKNRALRGELTKTKKRIAGGVCPCCNRTFENLSRHMKGQHPDFATSAVSA